MTKIYKVYRKNVAYKWTKTPLTTTTGKNYNTDTSARMRIRFTTGYQIKRTVTVTNSGDIL